MPALPHRRIGGTDPVAARQVSGFLTGEGDSAASGGKFKLVRSGVKVLLYATVLFVAVVILGFLLHYCCTPWIRRKFRQSRNMNASHKRSRTDLQDRVEGAVHEPCKAVLARGSYLLRRASSMGNPKGRPCRCGPALPPSSSKQYFRRSTKLSMTEVCADPTINTFEDMLQALDVDRTIRPHWLGGRRKPQQRPFARPTPVPLASARLAPVPEFAGGQSSPDGTMQRRMRGARSDATTAYRVISAQSITPPPSAQPPTTRLPRTRVFAFDGSRGDEDGERRRGRHARSGPKLPHAKAARWPGSPGRALKRSASSSLLLTGDGIFAEFENIRAGRSSSVPNHSLTNRRGDRDASSKGRGASSSGGGSEGDGGGRGGGGGGKTLRRMKCRKRANVGAINAAPTPTIAPGSYMKMPLTPLLPPRLQPIRRRPRATTAEATPEERPAITCASAALPPCHAANRNSTGNAAPGYASDQVGSSVHAIEPHAATAASFSTARRLPLRPAVPAVEVTSFDGANCPPAAATTTAVVIAPACVRSPSGDSLPSTRSPISLPDLPHSLSSLADGTSTFLNSNHAECSDEDESHRLSSAIAAPSSWTAEADVPAASARPRASAATSSDASASATDIGGGSTTLVADSHVQQRAERALLSAFSSASTMTTTTTTTVSFPPPPAPAPEPFAGLSECGSTQTVLRRPPASPEPQPSVAGAALSGPFCAGDGNDGDAAERGDAPSGARDGRVRAGRGQRPFLAPPSVTHGGGGSGGGGHGGRNPGPSLLDPARVQKQRQREPALPAEAAAAAAAPTPKRQRSRHIRFPQLQLLSRGSLKDRRSRVAAEAGTGERVPREHSQQHSQRPDARNAEQGQSDRGVDGRVAGLRLQGQDGDGAIEMAGRRAKRVEGG
ncbi:hypothetical protein BDY21DRAFT_374287 [Lineolata rhizophorae]|uniref:Uncharacterized protein n=1 Tax=Lineolata rhizophorae TaxID=578093 RepID=A0A6A6NQI0_9PEZI|nr:hypothetical protein BDY21DRAFT_374287 [Lineolata rhizophorae]